MEGFLFSLCSVDGKIKNSPAVKKMCSPVVKKDVKSKVVVKKWL